MRILVLLLLCIPSLRACPGCGGISGQTLLGEFNSADLVAVGVLKNAVRDLDDPSKNRTEFHITSVVKTHPFLAGKTVLVLPKYLPPDRTDPDAKVMIFCNLNPRSGDVVAAALAGGLALANFDHYTLDPYRGDPIGKDTKLADYIKGAIAQQGKSVKERLEYFFPYLVDTEKKVSDDAYLEFANADYKDVREACAKLPMDEIAKRLVDPNTPASQIGLYSLMLGHSGNKKDAVIIRNLLDNPKKLYSSGLDGLLIAYVLLDPTAGWDYILNCLKNPQETFQTRFACVAVLKFFIEFRPDVLSDVQKFSVYRTILSVPDIADMAIDDLRKRGTETLNAEVFAAAKSEEHLKQSFARKSLFKYLVTHAQIPEAAALLNDLRSKYPEGVKAAEDAIALEREARK